VAIRLAVADEFTVEHHLSDKIDLVYHYDEQEEFIHVLMSSPHPFILPVEESIISITNAKVSENFEGIDDDSHFVDKNLLELDLRLRPEITTEALSSRTVMDLSKK